VRGANLICTVSQFVGVSGTRRRRGHFFRESDSYDCPTTIILVCVSLCASVFLAVSVAVSLSLLFVCQSLCNVHT